MRPQTTRIHLIRHGRVHNPQDLFYGRLPGFHLSPEGRSEAQRAGRHLAREPLAALFASPLERARETARAIARFHSGLAVHESELLTEVATPFEGRTQAAVTAAGGNVYRGSSPPFETPPMVLTRGRRFLQEVRSKWRGAQVAAVTHGDVILFLLLWARGLPATAEAKLHFAGLRILESYPATGSITSLAFHTEDPDEQPQIAHTVPS